MQNVEFNSCAGAWVSVDSTGSKTNQSVGSWEFNFMNSSINITGTVGCGPGMTVGPVNDWNFIDHSQIQGNALEASAITSLSRSSGTVTVTTTASLPTSWSGTLNLGIAGASDSSFDGVFPATVTSTDTFTYSQSALANASATGGSATSDQEQAIVFEPTTGTATDNNYISNSYFVYGGARAYSGSTQAVGLSMNNMLQEAGYAPILDFASCPSGGGVKGSAANFEAADQNTTLPNVRSACTILYNSLQVQNVGLIQGAMTMLGGAYSVAPTQDPLLTGATGISGPRLFGQTDAAHGGLAR